MNASRLVLNYTDYRDLACSGNKTRLDLQAPIAKDESAGQAQTTRIVAQVFSRRLRLLLQDGEILTCL